MKIITYLKELILSSECVILPGLGGFETHYQAAKVDKQKNIFEPPSKYIRFRPDLIKDNGVLLKYLMDKEKISEVEAEKQLKDFVSDINSKLKLEGQAILQGIGVLKKQIGGKIVSTTGI